MFDESCKFFSTLFLLFFLSLAKSFFQRAYLNFGNRLASKKINKFSNFEIVGSLKNTTNEIQSQQQKKREPFFIRRFSPEQIKRGKTARKGKELEEKGL